MPGSHCLLQKIKSQKLSKNIRHLFHIYDEKAIRDNARDFKKALAE